MKYVQIEDILSLAGAGLTTQQIAERVGLSRRGVRDRLATHRRKLTAPAVAAPATPPAPVSRTADRIPLPRTPDGLDHGWQNRAACRGLDPELWFPLDLRVLGAVEQAKAICGRCEVQPECLRWALEVPERYGVWGGHTPDERAAIHRRQVTA